MSIKRLLAVAAFLFLLPFQPACADNSAPSYVELADAPTITVDWSKGDTQEVTLGGDRKLAFTNGQRGGKYMLILKQDATGSRKVTWPESVRWPGGPPQSQGLPANVLTTTASRKDFLSLFYDGESYDVLSLFQNY